MNSCRYHDVAKNSALFQKLVAGEWTIGTFFLIIGPTKSNSYCQPRYIIRSRASAARLISARAKDHRSELPKAHLCTAGLLVAAPH